MKFFQNVLLISLFTLVFSNCNSQTKAKEGEKKLNFKVWGNCEMCKETIETSLDVKGVKSANWNVDSKMIEVVFQPENITEDKIHTLIGAAGYDTEKVKGNNKAYQELAGCCQYTRKP